VSLVPTSLTVLLGSNPSKKGMMRVYRLLQCEPLLVHLAYTALDDLMMELFPDCKKILKPDS